MATNELEFFDLDGADTGPAGEWVALGRSHRLRGFGRVELFVSAGWAQGSTVASRKFRVRQQVESGGEKVTLTCVRQNTDGGATNGIGVDDVTLTSSYGGVLLISENLAGEAIVTVECWTTLEEDGAIQAGDGVSAIGWAR